MTEFRKLSTVTDSLKREITEHSGHAMSLPERRRGDAGWAKGETRSVLARQPLEELRNREHDIIALDEQLYRFAVILSNPHIWARLRTEHQDGIAVRWRRL